MVRSLIILAITFLFIQENLKGQPQETAPNTYILFLKDKKYNAFTVKNPGVFLSQKAIDRRSRQGISIDSADLPVSAFYIDSLKKLGLQIHNISRWFNSVTFKIRSSEELNIVGNLSFVQKIEKTIPLNLKINNSKVLYNESAESDSSIYGFSYRQIHIHNGEYLHKNGLKGENMLIAIIDAGFNSYQTLSSFQNIRSENRIKSIRDFVAHDGEVNSDHSHGANVFSIIGGEIENIFMGTAPKADFLLLRSEDATSDIFGIQSEYLVEEDNWISAAEYADSLGTDVINTSLGYSTFNNPEQNHTYTDMNGTTTRISKAAEMAFKKGMIVVVSAGNEGDNPWHYISAPADAENVLAVGAINSILNRAGFSSVGPSFDNRIKPDVMALGQGTFIQSTNNMIVSGNGTSFSAPVIAGLTACLWQGSKNKTNMEIIEAVRQSSDMYLSPNNNYGYGIPDFKKALLKLNPTYENKKGLLVYPNPFTTHLTLFHEALNDHSLTIEIYNTAGRKLYTKIFPIIPNTAGEIEIPDISSIQRGIVFIRAIAGDKVLTTTAIKL